MVAWTIKDEFDRTSRDVDLMVHFKEIYYAQETRRFAVHFVRRVSDPGTQRQLREFIVWDVLENHVGGDVFFVFDREHDDWHLVGEVVLDMSETATREGSLLAFSEWWECSIKSHAMERWNTNSGSLEVFFGWVENTYNINNTQAPRTLCKNPASASGNEFEQLNFGEKTAVLVYVTFLVALTLFGLYRVWLAWFALQYSKNRIEEPRLTRGRTVLVQLPVYNEEFTVRDSLLSLVRLEFGKRDNVQVQIVDDSDPGDRTREVVEQTMNELDSGDRKRTRYLRRLEGRRAGFKAGALRFGLEDAGEDTPDLIAVFDADFRPEPDFLKRVVGHFEDDRVAFVQCRWDHMNRDASLLAAIQANGLDAHFAVEQMGRNAHGLPFNFNGTAGVWRTQAILDAGNWSGETLTEDLHLAYRTFLTSPDKWNAVFRNDVTVPSELPLAYSSFLRQQRRWARGSLQTLRRVFLDVWLSRWSFRAKLSAMFHLLANFQYTILLILALAQYWIQDIHTSFALAWLRSVEWVVLLVGFVCLVVFFSASRRILDRQASRAAWRETLMAATTLVLGVALCFNNGIAALQGVMLRGTGTFERTTKYGSNRGPIHGHPLGKVTLDIWDLLNLLAPLIMTAYFAWLIYFHSREDPVAVSRPFLWVFLMGFAVGLTATVIDWLKNLLRRPDVPASGIVKA